jgi:hypothetical protein
VTVEPDAGIHHYGSAVSSAGHWANAASFTLVNSVLLKNLPVTDPNAGAVRLIVSSSFFGSEFRSRTKTALPIATLELNLERFGWSRAHFQADRLVKRPVKGVL